MLSGMTPRVLLLLVAVLMGCAAAEGPSPPPYEVYFADSVPEADKASWGAAAGDWNAALADSLGMVFWVGSGPAEGRCGIEIRLVEEWYDATTPAWTVPQRDCLTPIYYARGQANAVIALHELGHQIVGERHVPGTVMDAWPDEYEPVVTAALVERAVKRWGP